MADQARIQEIKAWFEEAILANSDEDDHGLERMSPPRMAQPPFGPHGKERPPHFIFRMNPKLTHFKTVSEWAAADYYRAQKWCPGKTWKELREIFHSDYEGEDDEDIQFTGEVRKESPMEEDYEIEEVGPSTSTIQRERQPSSSSLKHKLPRRIVTNEEEEGENNDAILEEQPTTSTQAQKQLLLPTPDLITLGDEDEAVDADDEEEVISLGQPSTSQSTSGRASRVLSRPADDLDGDEIEVLTINSRPASIASNSKGTKRTAANGGGKANHPERKKPKNRGTKRTAKEAKCAKISSYFPTYIH